MEKAHFMTATPADAAGCILQVLALSEVNSAWCFWPVNDSWTMSCSRAFQSFWNLPKKHDETDQEFNVTRLEVLQAMSRSGIEGEQVFREISNVGRGEQRRLSLYAMDGRRLDLSVTPVPCADRVIGHMVRFTVQTSETILEAVLREVDIARRQIDGLTPREREVLRYIADGNTNKAVSLATGISEKTVEKHRARILQKLGLPTTAHLLQLVARATLFDRDERQIATRMAMTGS
jgi:DNA-binding CsgD family transcriptional regulator